MSKDNSQPNNEDTSLIDDLTPDNAPEEGDGKEGVKSDIPEGIDPNFWDAEKKAVKSDELMKAYKDTEEKFKKEEEKAKGLRKIISEKGSFKAPKDASEYTIEDEAVKAMLPDESIGMKSLRDSAFEAGIPKEAFAKFVAKLMPTLKENGILAEEKTPEQQAEEDKAYRDSELEKLGKDGPKIRQTVVNFGQGLVNKGVLSKDELPAYNQLVYNAQTMKVLSKIINLTGEHSIPTNTVVSEGLPSKQEIDEIIKSKEYQNGDTKAHKKVADYFKAVHA